MKFLSFDCAHRSLGVSYLEITKYNPDDPEHVAVGPIKFDIPECAEPQGLTDISHLRIKVLHLDATDVVNKLLVKIF